MIKLYFICNFMYNNVNIRNIIIKREECILFGIKYETWASVCQMYIDLEICTKKAYLQWFPFAKISEEDWRNIKSEEFFSKYIKSGAFVIFPDAMYVGENFVQKSDGSFRNAVLLSPIVYLVLQSIGKEISENYTCKRKKCVEVYYAGSYEEMRCLYKQDYDYFFKSINKNIEEYQYFIKTDISDFFSGISIDKLVHQIDMVCNLESTKISQNHLQLYKEFLSYCGFGRFPLVENSVASSYLATVVYLDMIDCKIYDYISNNMDVFSDFRIVRYVDDMYILISSDKPKENLYEAYNEIRNEISSILKEYGLSINSKKSCIKETYEINEELKKSLYDECFNGRSCEISQLFSGKSLNFIKDIYNEVRNNNIIDIEKYNAIIKENFSLEDIEFTASEVFNYFVYEDEYEFKKPEFIEILTQLVKKNISFIFLDPKRLTIMIMKTNCENAIRAFLNQLFVRNRKNIWNSYDTIVAVNYLIQSKFRHIDLLKIIEQRCPNLYKYYFCFCKNSFQNVWNNKFCEKIIDISVNDTKSFFLYFMYLVEKHKNNSLAMFAYFKNFFDRMIANIAFSERYEANLKKPNYKRFYKEKELIKFCGRIMRSGKIIGEAHKLRNANPLSHSSAELLDKDSTSKDIGISICNLSKLLEDLCKNK